MPTFQPWSILFIVFLARSWAVQFNIVDDGAVADGVTDNTQAILKTLARAIAYDLPSTVMVPAGDFLTGALRIPSNVTLHLARGAILRASDNASLYSGVPSLTSDTGRFDFPFLLIDQAHHVQLEGEGRIDAGANSPPGHLVLEYRPATNMLMPTEWTLPNCSYFSCRPKLLVVRYSQWISFRDLTMSNSPLWTVTVVESEQILFDNVTITGDRRWPNNDGIDLINARHVSIRNSNISTGDDCIAIVSHGPSAMYNITVENMDLQSTSAAIKVSSFEDDANGEMRQITFRKIRITDSNRGICVAPRWGASSLSDFLFEDMTIETRYFGLDWWGTGEPIHITGLSKRVDQPWTGVLRNFTLRNIVARGEQGAIIRGNTSVLENLYLENISLKIARWSNVTEHPMLDYRPSQEPETVKASVDGLFARDIKGLSLRSVTIEFEDPKQSYYGQCLNLADVTQVVQQGVDCRGAIPSSAGIPFDAHPWMGFAFFAVLSLMFEKNEMH